MELQRNAPALNHPVNQGINFARYRKTVISGMMDRPWFTDKNFSSLVIRKNKSLADHAVVRSVTITDLTYIGKLAGRIEQIPPDGDMMISFSGGAEHIELAFSTGFNTKNDYEKALYAELDALLFPATGKLLPKVAGLTLDFGDFTLRYKGTRFEDLAPATLSFHIAEFDFTDKNGRTEAIAIYDGQLPPPPYTIKANGLSILTFHAEDDKRIYPDFFQVV
jgi:hypothetical protein